MIQFVRSRNGPRNRCGTAALGCVFATGLGLVWLAGCAQQTTQIEARKEATGRWNMARARVKAQLAADQLAAGNVTDASAEIEKALAE